jgi:trimeric autotransporter adhesin
MYFVTYKAFAPCSDKNSDTVKVTVFPASFVSTDPVNTTVCQGTTATLTAKGKNSVSVSWMKGTSAVTAGGNIAITNTVAGDSTVSTLTITNAAFSDTGAYKFVSVTGGTGCANDTSAVATLSINAKPTITSTTFPATTVCAGTTMSFAVTASNNSRVVWYGGATGTDSIQNATSFTLPATAGIYKVKVIGNSPCGDTTSASVTTTVTPLATITTPVILSNPICAGSTTTVSANFTNADSVVWFQGTTRLGLGTVAAGTSTFTVSSAGTYTARAYSANGCINVDSTSATLSINAKPTITSTTLPATTVCAGTTMSFAVTASNNSRVVWYGGATGTDSIQNATSFTLPATAGIYKVKVIGNSPCGDTTSASVTTTVTPLAAFTTQPSSDTVCEGSMLSFSTVASNADSIVWYRGTTNVTGGTTYVVNTASSIDSGNYKAIAYSANGCKNDTSITVLGLVKPKATITTQPVANTYVLTGANAP